MILHPGIVALLAGSSLVLLLTCLAVGHGLAILRRWDFASSSAGQLALERKTYLVSTIMNWVLGFQVAGAFLFVFTAEDIHTLFVGAMCATGSLNANPVGWNALAAKIVLAFLSGIWIALNHLDGRAEDYPLVRPKYVLLTLLFPLFALDLYLQARYFLGLKPDIITSCCGSLFTEAGEGVASALASLPLGPAMGLFYGGVALFLLAGALCLRFRAGLLRYTLSLLSLGLVFVSIAATVSFISPYWYELPSHHCPFDVLQAGYQFVGYPIYAGMFGGTFFGMLPGSFQRLKRLPTLKATIDRRERAWVLLAMGLVLGSVVLASYPVVFGAFTMFE